MIYVALMLMAGCLMAIQSPINAALSRTVGILESSLISFSVGTASLLIAVLLFGHGHVGRVFSCPPWQWLGGVLGAIMVLNAIIAVPHIGAVSTLLAMVIGNLVMASIIDNFGWFGLPVTPFTLKRIFGFCLVFAGLWCVMRQ